MNRVALQIIAVIISLISSTYGDYGDGDDVVSRQRRETKDSNGLTIGGILLIFALTVAALILRWIIIDSFRRCCSLICIDEIPTEVTVIQQAPAVYAVNNGQNNLGFVPPSQPEIRQDLPPPYNPNDVYTKQVQVSDCKSNYTQPK